MQTVVFDGLPIGLREECLRLKVEGPKGTVVYGMKLWQIFTEKAPPPQPLDLQKKIRAQEDQRIDLSDRIASLKAEVELALVQADTDSSVSAGAHGRMTC